MNTVLTATQQQTLRARTVRSEKALVRRVEKMAPVWIQELETCGYKVILPNEESGE